MIASWVAQASFEPLGFTVAVAKDRAIESLMQVGDRFALNCLPDGDFQPIMKHFLKRFPPGADRFEGVKWTPASCGAPILLDAVAHMECQVVRRMEADDHWVVRARARRVWRPSACCLLFSSRGGPSSDAAADCGARPRNRAPNRCMQRWSRALCRRTARRPATTARWRATTEQKAVQPSRHGSIIASWPLFFSFQRSVQIYPPCSFCSSPYSFEFIIRSRSFFSGDSTVTRYG